MNNSITKDLNIVIDKVIEELDLIEHRENSDEVVPHIYQTLHEVLNKLQNLINKGHNQQEQKSLLKKVTRY